MREDFTNDQNKVVEIRDCNVLVSAAAGSGKTTVLVERVITRLIHDNPPLNVDQLLIVTFTDAAASEMKERIHDAIEKALQEHPDNEHLQRQATLIHQAKIMTIDSFCSSVIRENFHAIDLDPSYRVGEDGELKLLKHDVLEAVIESYYEKGSPEFISFVECFASRKDDCDLENLILRIHNRAQSYPDPEEWINSCTKNYQIDSEQALDEAAFITNLLLDVRQIFRDLQLQVEYAKTICDEEDGPLVYKTALDSDMQQLQRLSEIEHYVELHQALDDGKWKTFDRIKKGTVCEIKQQQVKDIRETYKKVVNDIKKKYFFDSVENIRQDMCYAGEHTKVLLDMAKTFGVMYAEAKRKKNLIDFNDMEHLALEILTEKREGKRVPTVVAKTYQEKFAEIMIDEYQDSNYLQEELLTSVSGISNGIYNIFMVGDVKQSVYSFRLARPDLFMRKYESYSSGHGNKQKIGLHKNFRSRKEVLDGTNAIFEQIMIPSLGGITYNDEVALHVGAKYEEKPSNELELLLMDIPKSDSNQRMEMEAELIANQIKNLVGKHEILDKKTKQYRKAEYKDIVILTRSPKKWNDVLSEILGGAGVPTYVCGQEGYFQAQEVQILLNYLQILDNPRQDIPFVSVLTSMFVGINSEELALIKTHENKKSMYEATCNYAKCGEKEALKKRLCTFLEQFELLRSKVSYQAIHELLFEILSETGYGDYVASLPGGKQRAANIEMLLEKAVTFEGTSYKGLFNFIRYINQLKKYDIDYGEAALSDENSNVVCLMSIHKSKGLEFPIVIVAGLGREFVTKDIYTSITVHSDLGVGIDCIDPIQRTKTSTLLKRVIQQRMISELVSEEMRLLYVAMTRAKEKLILTAIVNGLEKKLKGMEALQQHKERELPYLQLSKGMSYLDLVLAALSRNQCFADIWSAYGMCVPFQNAMYKKEFPIRVKLLDVDDLVESQVVELVGKCVTKDILKTLDINTTYSIEMKEKIEKQFEYQYPHQKSQSVKQKVSVSELKRLAYEEEEGAIIYKEEEVIPLLPKFMQENETLKGASRGTAYHKLLEILDFSIAYDEASLVQEMENIKQKGLMSEEMVSCIHAKDILGFVQSEIGQRLQNASKKGACFSEQPFVLGVEEQEELMLVQGIIDVYFEENGELVVLDYKTDRVSFANELVDKYHTQLEYYAMALERLTGKKVKEKIIYSFTLKQEIKV